MDSHLRSFPLGLPSIKVQPASGDLSHFSNSTRSQPSAMQSWQWQRDGDNWYPEISDDASVWSSGLAPESRDAEAMRGIWGFGNTFVETQLLGAHLVAIGQGVLIFYIPVTL